MNYLVKAGLSVSAMLMAGQVHAADFLLSASPAVDYHFTTGTPIDLTAPSITATISNFPDQGTFSDRYFFSIPYPQGGLGSGSVTSPSSLTLTFDNGLGVTAVTVTEYSASQAFLTDLYTKGYLGGSADYATELAAIQAYVTANPGAKTNEWGGSTVPNSTGGLVSSIGGLPLNNQSFYILTVVGTNTGGSYGGSATVAAVPEPATWAMLLAGFGIVGFAMRRRSNQQVKVSFA